MKKTFSTALCVTMLFMLLSVTASAVTYSQPFPSGTVDSETFRIPALITLKNGSVLAGADIRYGHGLDSPNNNEVFIAHSKNGYADWNYKTVFYFDDYADGVTDTLSASYIDSALIQSSETGRIFMVTDAQPSACGYLQAKQGSGFIEIDGKKHLLLTDGNNTDEIDTFDYYVGEFENGFAAVYEKDRKKTSYSVDEELNLYKDGEPLYLIQEGSEGVEIQQNVYYNSSELCCYCTTYLVMRYSDDNGKNWSHPINLSSLIKKESEGFLGIAPGRGFVTEANGKERILFTVYDNDGGTENVSTIYSDDNGKTWNRGEETVCRKYIGKTSESQIVELNNGTLRMYARNNGKYVAYADSNDKGKSWSKFVADTQLSSVGNCMVSFINTSRTIDGKKVILGSYPSSRQERADGVVRVGLVDETNKVKWISKYHINSGFFAYSCLTELSDGNFGLLYEDQPYQISYMVLSLSDEGELSEINGNNIEYESDETFFETVKRIFETLFDKFLSLIGLL